MAKVNWTDRSIEDLINIAEFIKKDSIKYARLTIQRLRTSAVQAGKYPLSGRIVPEAEIIDLREILIGNYRLIYKIVSKDRIDIITVFHTSRNLYLTEIEEDI